MAIYSHSDKSIALDELIPLVKEDFLAKDLFALKCILIDMVSRLKKMKKNSIFTQLRNFLHEAYPNVLSNLV
jgi:hypothetical protein